MMFSFLLKKRVNAIFFTATGVLSCGGSKISPRTPSIVWIVYYLWFSRSAKVF